MLSFPGSAWERAAFEAPPRAPAGGGDGAESNVALARQSLAGSAFPGRAWEREKDGRRSRNPVGFPDISRWLRPSGRYHRSRDRIIPFCTPIGVPALCDPYGVEASFRVPIPAVSACGLNRRLMSAIPIGMNFRPPRSRNCASTWAEQKPSKTRTRIPLKTAQIARPRQSLAGSAFPGRAWERERMKSTCR